MSQSSPKNAKKVQNSKRSNIPDVEIDRRDKETGIVTDIIPEGTKDDKPTIILMVKQRTLSIEQHPKSIRSKRHK